MVNRLVSVNDSFQLPAVVDAVRRGELVFNIKDYGAVCDWTGGTNGTINTAAVRATIAAAQAAVSTGTAYGMVRILVPGGLGNGYNIDDTITIPPNVEIDMRAKFVYTGPTGRPALVIGDSGHSRLYETHTVRVWRSPSTDWSNEADVGVVFTNLYHSTINLMECFYFTVGASFTGNTVGVSYNQVRLGYIANNKVGIDLTTIGTGWCNENTFYGGDFQTTGDSHRNLARIGIRITSTSTPSYYCNSNVFYRPAFEFGSTTSMLAVPFWVVYGINNRVTQARHENSSLESLVQQNNSTGNSINFSSAPPGVLVVNQGTSSSGFITGGADEITDLAVRTIRKIDSLHLKACYYDGATSVNVAGVTIRNTSGVDVYSSSTLIMASSYLQLGSGECLGFYMSTRVLKHFSVFLDMDAGGRIQITPYDNTGTIIANVAGTVVGATTGSQASWNTAFGGRWVTGSNSTVPYHFGVSATTDYVFIAVAGAGAQIRSFSVATLEPFNPATWLGLGVSDDAPNYGTVAPTAGTWKVGRQVINAVPTAGQPYSWICSAAGTPGTWLALTSSAGAAASSDVQVFTTTGTWTKPTGAVSVEVLCVAPGGGGGAGRRGAAGTVRCGGGGGGGGGVTRMELPASAVTSPVTVTIGAVGTGGPAQSTDDSDGAPGVIGGNVNFGTYARASGGGFGVGGTAALGTGGAGGVGMLPGAAGGAANTAGGAGAGGASSLGGAGGGGSGGGVQSGNTTSAGGFSGACISTTNAGVTGGTANGGVGPNGTSQPVNSGSPGAAGAGGGSNITGAGGAGGVGGLYGAGGGGGGAALNGNNSGAGGDAAAGIIVVVSKF